MVSSLSSVAEVINKLPNITDCFISQINRLREDNLAKVDSILLDSLSLFTNMQIPNWPDIDKSFFGESFIKGIWEEIPFNLDFVRMYWLYSTELLGKHLWIKLPEKPLFDSPGAITRIARDWKVTGSFHNFKIFLSSLQLYSAISEKYDHNLLLFLSFKRAVFHHLFNLLSKWLPFSTEIVQEYLTKITGEVQYRWWISIIDPTTNNRNTYWTSGSSLNEKVVETIINETLWITIEKYCEIYKCSKFDIFSGLWDELLSSLIAWMDYRNVISWFAEDIGKCKKNNTMPTLN